MINAPPSKRGIEEGRKVATDDDMEKQIRDRIDSSVAQSTQVTSESVVKGLNQSFEPFLEKGKSITKASLIVRLERELEVVERQLAGISEVRTDNHRKAGPRSKRPSTAGRGRESRSQGISRKGNQRRRPQSASASSTRMRAPKTAVGASDGTQRGDGRGENSRFPRPSTAGSNRSRSAMGRPQTAGSNRPSTRDSSRSRGMLTTSSSISRGGERSSRPQSSPLVRLGASTKKPGKVPTIAGYCPPDLVYDDELLAQARQLNAADLNKMKDTALFKQACLKSGCTTVAIQPKSVSDFIDITIGFQRLHLKEAEAHERWLLAEERRLKLLATVLTERQNIIDEMKAKAWTRDPSNPNARPPSNNLTGMAAKALVEEQRRAKQVKMQQMRIHSLLVKDNSALELRREEYAKRMERRAGLEKAYSDRVAKEERLKAEKARRKEENLRLANDMRRKLDEERLRKGEETQRKKFERSERIRQSKAAASSEKEKIEFARKAHQMKVKEDRDKVMLQKQEESRIRISQKDTWIARQHALKKQKHDEKKKEALFKANEKRQNLQRIQAQQNYHRIQLAGQLKLFDEKRKKVNQLKSAVIEERRKERKEALINQHRLKDSTPVDRNIMPGPGAYTLPDMIGGKGKGFKVSDANPLGYVDIIVNRAKQVPGPNAYGFADYPKRQNAVKFSDANVPSDVELIMRRSASQPGPDAYQDGMRFESASPAISWGSANPKSDVDWIMARSAAVPGPADYAPGLPELRKSPLKKVAKQLGVDVDSV